MTGLRSLNLHCNCIVRITSLERLTSLTYLNLSSNRIDTMSGLHALTGLQTLDLSCNLIRMIDGLATLSVLQKLHLSYNKLGSAGVRAIGAVLEAGALPKLTMLYLGGNKDISEQAEATFKSAMAETRPGCTVKM